MSREGHTTNMHETAEWTPTTNDDSRKKLKRKEKWGNRPGFVNFAIVVEKGELRERSRLIKF